ncbi:MAG: glycosyltransferase, partial [Candidatus Methylopumilus sp.]|nr:glycosyltransferase [Candidatus Methylopumilus sp.]
IEEMDLVISVCTSVAHLSGALGHPTWVLLPYSADYRWLVNRNDSPWYPTVAIFRTQSIGDWSSVISNIIVQLKVKFAN